MIGWGDKVEAEAILEKSDDVVAKKCLRNRSAIRGNRTPKGPESITRSAIIAELPRRRQKAKTLTQRIVDDAKPRAERYELRDVSGMSALPFLRGSRPFFVPTRRCGRAVQIPLRKSEMQ